MASMTLVHGADSMTAALCTPMRERFGSSPIQAAQGTSVPFAGYAAAVRTLAPTHNVVDRKADGWVPPRGRTL